MPPALRHLCCAGLLTGILGVGGTVSEGRAVVLPTGFDGLYAPEGMPCSQPERISVAEGVITGAEWSWTVTDLIELAGEPNRVEASLAVSAGGGDWTESAVITLDSDGQGPVLVLDYPDGTRNIWTRCD